MSIMADVTYIICLSLQFFKIGIFDTVFFEALFAGRIREIILSLRTVLITAYYGFYQREQNKVTCEE